MRTTILTTAALLALAAPAAAERYEVGVAGGADFTHSDSVDALAEGDAHGALRAHAAAALPGLALWGFGAEVELSWDHGGLSGTTFQTLRSELDTDTFTASFRLRRSLWRRLSGYGRAGLSWATADLELRDPASGAEPIRDGDSSFGTALAAGADLELLSELGGPLRFGLRAELGYQLLTAFHFDAARDQGDGDELRIAPLSADLGELDASGPMLRIGVYGRF